MSRLYGKSIDVYQTSKYLIDASLKKYKPDKTKTSEEELSSCPEKIELYLPDNAIEIIENNPIRIVLSPLAMKKASHLPTKKGEEPTLIFPRNKPIEEYKRELVFFLGTIISLSSPDLLPKDDNIPCEYGDLISLLLEYLYLKEIGKEEDFSRKHLKELEYNSRKYVINYDRYKKYLLSRKENNLYQLSEEQEEQLNKQYAEQEILFLKSTLTCLVPLSSMDGVLQIIDEIKDTNDIKKLLEKLIENDGNNRQKIINDLGIESFGYKRLRKEIDRTKRNE